MALTDNKINGNTPVRNFPDVYNNLIDQLVSEINRLNNTINVQNRTIKDLKSVLYTLTGGTGSAENISMEEFSHQVESYLDARYQAIFDRKMEEFEGKFVKKTTNN